MTILFSEAQIRAIPVIDSGEPLCVLSPRLSPSQCLVRVGVAERLEAAQELLAHDLRLTVLEGHRSAPVHLLHLAQRTAAVCAYRPGIGPSELDQLVSQVVAPAELSPYLTGSAVSVTLSDATGHELDLGTPVGVFPESYPGLVPIDASALAPEVLAHRAAMAGALRAVGLVNHPAAWWQWSWGDRTWALHSGGAAAVHGPIATPRLLAA